MKTLAFLALALAAGGFAFGAEKTEDSIFDSSAPHIRKFAAQVQAENQTRVIESALAILERERPEVNHPSVITRGWALKADESAQGKPKAL